MGVCSLTQRSSANSANRLLIVVTMAARKLHVVVAFGTIVTIGLPRTCFETRLSPVSHAASSARRCFLPDNMEQPIFDDSQRLPGQTHSAI